MQEEMFLSKAVLMELIIVHEDFPRVLDKAIGISSVSDSSCPCIPRTTDLPLPTALSDPLQENNREKIEKFLLVYRVQSL